MMPDRSTRPTLNRPPLTPMNTRVQTQSLYLCKKQLEIFFKQGKKQKVGKPLSGAPSACPNQLVERTSQYSGDMTQSDGKARRKGQARAGADLPQLEGARNARAARENLLAGPSHLRRRRVMAGLSVDNPSLSRRKCRDIVKGWGRLKTDQSLALGPTFYVLSHDHTPLRPKSSDRQCVGSEAKSLALGPTCYLLSHDHTPLRPTSSDKQCVGSEAKSLALGPTCYLLSHDHTPLRPTSSDKQCVGSEAKSLALGPTCYLQSHDRSLT
ncbi:hypothetical protein RRG08_030176 [Elysia crispata]|uniref:Uncharacterized protein n=1 Tax=Elysia crispata TaxID=231223 RepID=A0AAE0ZRA4_9GAST|nr:hypothetical protein RRG08_030176 [Elysia crispata]